MLHGFSISAFTSIYAASKLTVKAVIADGAADDLLDAIFRDFKLNPMMRLLVPSLRLNLMTSNRVNEKHFTLYRQSVHYVVRFFWFTGKTNLLSYRK